MNDEVDYPVSELFYSKTSGTTRKKQLPNDEIDYPCSELFYSKASGAACKKQLSNDEEYFKSSKVISILESIGILMRKKTPGKKKGVKF